MEQKKVIKGQCPNCSFLLHINEGESVTCPSCDSVIRAEDIVARPTKQYANVFADKQANTAAQYAQNIENPSSGLAYLENRFEVNDWNEFETNLVFKLQDITTVVEKNKVTNADKPDTWLLEFKSIIVPMTHKIHGVQTLIDQIADEYDPLDLTNTFTKFDDYLRLASAMVSRRESTYKILESDIKFLEKFKAPAATVDAAKKDFAAFKADYDKIQTVSKLEELPSVEKAISKIEKNIEEELAKDGINAEETYKEAIEDFNSPTRFTKALSKFQSLKGYKDSSDYIKKINKFAHFNGLLEMNGKLYYAITRKQTETFNVNAPAQSSAPANTSGGGCSSKTKAPVQSSVTTVPTYHGSMTTIYAVENKEYDPKKPIVQKISAFLTNYNGKLFFISENKDIKAYDFTNNALIDVDNGKSGCYPKITAESDYRFVFSSDRKAIFLKKRLEARPMMMQNKGCGKKAKEEIKPSLNNFSLIKIDLATAQVSTVVSEIVDVMDVFGDYIFFNQSRDVDKVIKGKRNRDVIIKVPQTFFSSYNLKTCAVEDMLDEHAFIIASEGSKIVYSRYSPVTYNMDLYVFDADTKESLLLEDNIYDAYPKLHDGKVLYSVGSYYRRSMFSIKLDGTERTEIMLNVENIQWYDKNWMYVIKGYGFNTTLIKISYDGKTRVVVATSVDRIIKMTEGYVYYVDKNGDLCMARNDGLEEDVITGNCKDAKIIIDADNLFLMSKESMDYSRKVVNSSLYKMDLEGHNLKKVYYGLLDMEELDEQRIFLLKEETRKYIVTTPQEKGDPIISYITPKVKTYYSYNKVTKEMTPIFILGEPKEKTFEFKKGCIFKKK